MNSDGKKISFGFSKLSKKTNVLVQPPKHEKSVELIDCLEGAEIKVKNAVENVEKAPLIIPIKGDANGIVSQIERESLKNRKIRIEVKNEDSRPDCELTIEELAARQLIREARNKLAQNKDTTKVHTLPLEDNESVQDGIEPSMGDYEDVPIEDFGLACLRGMGWKEGMSIGKNQSKFVKPPEPDLRPKGLGLGAQKMMDTQAKEVFDKNGKKLVLAKGAFGKIVAGPHRGKLCEVQFCDEWSGRVSIKTSNTNEILTINELFVVPISKEEFVLGSKVINNAKYEQYKQKDEAKMKSNESNEDKMDNYTSSADEKYHRNSVETEMKRNRETRKERKQVKVEYDNSYEDSMKVSDNSHSKSGGGNRDNYRRSRSRGKTTKSNTSKLDRNSSADSNSSVYHGEKFEKTENKRHKSEKFHKEDSLIMKRRTSEESSEEYYRRKSETRDTSRTSSSESYKNSKGKSPILNSKYEKEKKRTKRYRSGFSDDDYRSNKGSKVYSQNRYSEKEKSCDDKSRWKRNENKNHRERRGSFSKEKSCDDQSRRNGNERKNQRKRRDSSSEEEKPYDDASRRNGNENKNNRKRRDSSSSEEESYHDERRRKRTENKNHRKRGESSSEEEESYNDERRRKKNEKKNHRKRRDSSSEEEVSYHDDRRRKRTENKNHRKRGESSSAEEESYNDERRRKKNEKKNHRKRRDSSSKEEESYHDERKKNGQKNHRRRRNSSSEEENTCGRRDKRK